MQLIVLLKVRGRYNDVENNFASEAAIKVLIPGLNSDLGWVEDVPYILWLGHMRPTLCARRWQSIPETNE